MICSDKAGLNNVSKPVLLFDSGLGGLSVGKAVRQALPLADIVYVADLAAFPYGGWQEEALLAHALPVLEDLIRGRDPAAIVVACNSLSTVILGPLRARFSGPVVGTVPAIKPAVESTLSRRVTVLATPGTVSRTYTRELVRQFAGPVHVDLVGSPGLATLAEAFLAGRAPDRDRLADEIAPCFQDGPVGDGSVRRTDSVVLACTHYPFLLEAMADLAPWPVRWIDPAPAIARRLCAVLDPAHHAGSGQLSVISTDPRQQAHVASLAHRLLDLDADIPALPGHSGADFPFIAPELGL